ncbi:methyltransferase domain-containing protein [Dactylosporangium sp. CS-033363]|uniref:methyltransferase domain-containing protein n=1 Tax=Dactylosporangium sp. CS-033363 TaxID=3239935 RepID=UPI003D8F7F83
MVDENYADAFQNADAVGKYQHVTYAPGSYAWRINQRQRSYLRAVVRREFADLRPTQHDFACGTGRAIRNLHGLVWQAHGYDTSPEMLAEAVRMGTDARLHVVGTAGPVPEPAVTGGPALVTMFRLLLNVDDAVRERALAFAAKTLPDAEAGVLVVENHGNRRSLRHLRARRHAGRRWFAELSHDQVVRLLHRHGFEVVARRGFSMLTPGWYERPLLRHAARTADGLACRLPGSAAWAVNVVYVARRTA